MKVGVVLHHRHSFLEASLSFLLSSSSSGSRDTERMQQLHLLASQEKGRHLPRVQVCLTSITTWLETQGTQGKQDSYQTVDQHAILASIQRVEGDEGTPERDILQEKKASSVKM
jgi:hypothetical protein